MSADTTLNYAKFSVAFIDLFDQDSELNGQLWPIRWGSSQMVFDKNTGLTLTSSAANGWAPVGFMQATTGKSGGEGYGLYQFTGYANAGQGEGITFLLWRADNLNVDPAQPNIAAEIDLLESWDGTKTGESTLHYYKSSARNGDAYQIHSYSADLTVSHTYAVDWERGSLAFYLDGQLLYEDTTHVPLDAADGGSNEVMGAEVTPPKTVTGTQVQLHITRMEYSAPIASVVSPPVSPNPAAIVTLGGGMQVYQAAAGATVQAGSGSNTISAPAGSVSVLGGSGSLVFQGSAGSDTVSGGAGSSTIFGATGGGLYTGGSAGNNVLVSRGAAASNTTLTGGGWGDRIFGSANGNDTLIARTGRETVVGGGGSETIIGGGTAACVIFAGSGPTNYHGGVFGGDIVVAGSGKLTATAMNGDAIFGGSGAASVTGSAAGGNADSIIGGSGALTFTGQGANAVVVAGSSTSTISTGDGATLIFGGSGTVNLSGGRGSMELVIGSGRETITEGSGPAFYEIVKGAAGGAIQVNGFRPGTDHISLYGYAAGQSHLTIASGSSTLSLSDGTTVLLNGVTNAGSSILG